jgi:hypothetical protein
MLFGAKRVLGVFFLDRPARRAMMLRRRFWPKECRHLFRLPTKMEASVRLCPKLRLAINVFSWLGLPVLPAADRDLAHLERMNADSGSDRGLSKSWNSSAPQTRERFWRT